MDAAQGDACQVRAAGQGGLQSTISISERPADAEDRAAPGHWEGDLIIGQGGQQTAWSESGDL